MKSGSNACPVERREKWSQLKNLSQTNLLYLLHLPFEIGFAAGPFELVLPLLSEELLHDRLMFLPLVMIPDTLCIHPGFPYTCRRVCNA